MALLEKELKIATIREIFQLKLTLPPYQRPYSWSKEATNLLFQDTYTAYQEGINEYRIGSVILHKENETYNIVDGQQRLTTLSILLYHLNKEEIGLLNEKYTQRSNDVIVRNSNVLWKSIKELKLEDKNKYTEYLLEQCSAVQIITDKEQEAFQFFDSQNSRGKELDPHDLLKSYHLREMNEEDENEKIKIINLWENVNQEDLKDLFKNYLFPLTQWYKGKNGLGYASDRIDVFKGIKITNVYQYALYHKASHLFVEQFNASGNNELLASKHLNQFQLTQPLIAGRRFFNYTLHYEKQLEKVRKLIKENFKDEEVPSWRSGDIYIKQLYECVLLFFADRFGIENLTQNVIRFFYEWSYSLRLVMQAVYPQTINKYANGNHPRLNYELDIFAQISEMNHADQLKLIVLEKADVIDPNKKKYKAINACIQKENGDR